MIYFATIEILAERKYNEVTFFYFCKLCTAEIGNSIGVAVFSCIRYYMDHKVLLILLYYLKTKLTLGQLYQR